VEHCQTGQPGILLQANTEASNAMLLGTLTVVPQPVLDRQRFARRGRRLEYFTIAWNSLEGLIAFVAGALAGSISLVGFGVDSFIEVTSGAALLWRMSSDADECRRERTERLSLGLLRRVFFVLLPMSGLRQCATSRYRELQSAASLASYWRASRWWSCRCFREQNGKSAGHFIARRCMPMRGKRSFALTSPRFSWRACC
jgi:hypothetical protein